MNNEQVPVTEKKGFNKSLIPIILGVLLIIIAVCIILFAPKKDNSSKNNNASDNKDTKVIENAVISGYMCFGSCVVNIGEDETEYKLSVDDQDLLLKLDDYGEYVTFNLYYTEDGNEKTIVNYKMFLASTNEEIKDVHNEKELRDKLGLLNEGTYTKELVLESIDGTSTITMDDVETTNAYYTFTDGETSYDMVYVIENDKTIPELVEGNTYKVTFEVEDTGFDFSNNIISIE